MKILKDVGYSGTDLESFPLFLTENQRIPAGATNDINAMETFTESNTLPKNENTACKSEKDEHKYNISGIQYTHLEKVERHDLVQNRLQSVSNECHLCGRPFLFPEQLSVHLRVHAAEFPYTCSCDICGKGFASLGHLSNHNLNHKRGGWQEEFYLGPPASFTPFSFPTLFPSVLSPSPFYTYSFSPLSHVPSPIPFNPFSIPPFPRFSPPPLSPPCPLSPPISSLQSPSPSPSGLLPLASPGGPVQPPHKSDKQHKCDICDKTFLHLGNVIRHKERHSAGDLYKYHCDNCGKKFQLNGSLIRHKENNCNLNNRKYAIKRKSVYRKKINAGKRTIKCEKEVHHGNDPCKDCPKLSGLTIRKKSNITEVKDYLCEVCGKQFHFLAFLIDHIKIHNPHKQYKCDFCGKEFSQKRTLSKHRNIHTKEKWYNCEICHKEFIHFVSLVGHRKIHTGVRPYTCFLCGKAFRQLQHLKRHKETHTGEARYKCNVCGKRVTTGSSLKAHIRGHTGETPYSCDICGRRFIHKRSVAAHKVIHTGDRPHQCETCGKCFTQNGSLITHKRKHLGHT